MRRQQRFRFMLEGNMFRYLLTVTAGRHLNMEL
jgi:hypothetical protein